MSCAVFAAALWPISGDVKNVSGGSDHPALSRIASPFFGHGLVPRTDPTGLRLAYKPNGAARAESGWGEKGGKLKRQSQAFERGAVLSKNSFDLE
jgi:hypothetical protein